ncbi:MAG: 4Fe-4S dicluster domain-containing protein [Balneolaceae bacterium]|nr:4Fe-4S dicluster domain-containing protein [Balneolaceae bacterium]
MITDRCINCGYCEKECPNQAIYEPGMTWSLDEGTSLKGRVIFRNGREVDASKEFEALSDSYYFIIPEKCAECKLLYDEPQCIAVCPNPESIIVHPEFVETEADLIKKQTELNQQVFIGNK